MIDQRLQRACPRKSQGLPYGDFECETTSVALNGPVDCYRPASSARLPQERAIILAHQIDKRDIKGIGAGRSVKEALKR